MWLGVWCECASGSDRLGTTASNSERPPPPCQLHVKFAFSPSLILSPLLLTPIISLCTHIPANLCLKAMAVAGLGVAQAFKLKIENSGSCLGCRLGVRVVGPARPTLTGEGQTLVFVLPQVGTIHVELPTRCRITPCTCNPRDRKEYVNRSEALNLRLRALFKDSN